MRSRTVIRLLALAAAFTLATVAPSTAGPFTRSPLKVVSVSSPFAGCDISGQPGVNFLNSEVEPWVEVNPTDPNNIVAAWQQDRGQRGELRAVLGPLGELQPQRRCLSDQPVGEPRQRPGYGDPGQQVHRRRGHLERARHAG